MVTQSTWMSIFALQRVTSPVRRETPRACVPASESALGAVPQPRAAEGERLCASRR